MYETLIRPHQVDVVPALPSIAAVADTLKRSEARREEKRLRQIAQAQRAAKRKRGEPLTEEEGGGEGEGEERRARGRREAARSAPPGGPAGSGAPRAVC